MSVKLTPGADDDLIGWWRSMPDGSRSEHIKTALRLALDLPLPQPTSATQIAQIAADTAWLRDALDSLPSYLERLMAGMGDSEAYRADRPPTLVSPDAGLSEADAARRARRMRHTQW